MNTTTSVVRSLMEFNRRVLIQGTPPAQLEEPEQIRDLLFFNRVFLTNTLEMFSKQDTDGIQQEYNDMIIAYRENIACIESKFYERYPDVPEEDAPILPSVGPFESWKDSILRELHYIDRLMELVEARCKKQEEELQKRRHLTFQEIFDHDVMIEYPEFAFDDYLDFLREAAHSKHVESIDLTLYRIGSDPSIFQILQESISNGIRVRVNIELFASGDEERNREWADKMRSAGIDVTTYQAGSIKVHCKLTLIRFRNGHRIVQIGTGNYHTRTTRQYTDLSVFTARKHICRCAEQLFKVLRGKNHQKFHKHFLVSRYNCRDRLYHLIDREAKKGNNGYIFIKCNALDDGEIIDQLNRAAMCGCRIELLVRGICTWVPEGMNIRIRSIIWDKLEHSRVYCFGKENPTILIGSLDPVKRKLNHRIEVLVQMKDPDVIIRMVDYINRYMTHNVNTWRQESSGIYTRRGM